MADMSEQGPTGGGSPERRKTERIKTRLTTVFTVRGSSKEHRALTQDLGGNGMCFVLEERLRLGDLLEVKLMLPDVDQPIALVAEVIWTEQIEEVRKSYQDPRMRVGVKFTQLNPKDRELLVRYAKMNAVPENF